MYLTTSSALWSRRRLDGVLAGTAYFGAFYAAAACGR